jgi:hypothetical protein
LFAAKLHIGVAIDEKRREDVMRNYHAIALSLLCGVGIGAAGVEGLRAQAKPPIYMIGNNDVSDADGYMTQSTESHRKAGSLSFAGTAWSSCWLGVIRLSTRRRARSARSTRSTMLSPLRAQSRSFGRFDRLNGACEAGFPSTSRPVAGTSSWSTGRTSSSATLRACGAKSWYSWVDSNHRPPDPQSGALTN